MDPRLSWFAIGAVFGLVLCGWPWHPRFSRYSCRRSTTCGGGEITRAEWDAMRTRLTESSVQCGNRNGGPTTPKPEIMPKPQFPPPRRIREDFLP